ncbi:MAG: hypothetical protein Q7R39_06695, partial [Dehalococcoidia bacterium]|nr:hypothetical protein [Dehalococcoidia bacterium]
MRNRIQAALCALQDLVGADAELDREIALIVQRLRVGGPEADDIVRQVCERLVHNPEEMDPDPGRLLGLEGWLAKHIQDTENE